VVFQLVFAYVALMWKSSQQIKIKIRTLCQSITTVEPPLLLSSSPLHFLSLSFFVPEQERSGGGILELMEQEIGDGGAGDLLRRQSSSTSLAFPSVRTAGEPKLKVRLSCRLQELYLLHEIELASGARAAWGCRVWRR
jgi:hypothetical protein